MITPGWLDGLGASPVIQK